LPLLKREQLPNLRTSRGRPFEAISRLAPHV
jgi:hypothetical protein